MRTAVFTAGLSKSLVNVTVDDAEPTSISFTSQHCLTLQPDEAGSSWEISPGEFVRPRSCHNQTLRRCDEEGARVSFKFTGVAVYLVYPPWPHEMTITATLDSDAPIFLTIPARSGESSVSRPEVDGSRPVWGLSGLQNTEHTLTISRQGGGVYVDAFMYTALCDTTLCRRRQGKPESPIEDDEPLPESSTTGSSTTGVSSTSGGFSSSSASPISSSSSPVSSPPASSPPSSSPPVSSPPVSSVSTSPLLPTTVDSRIARPHMDTVEIALGVLLGVLVVSAALAFFIFRRYRRRRPISPTYKEKPSPPYTASSILSSEPTRPPSMRERSNRFSDTHTPAGTPLTRTIGSASFLTSFSSNSMGLVSLSGPSHEKGTHLPSSMATSIRDDVSEAPMDVPPPQYETQP
ncbi:hypothetical protein B0H19DRAFT_1261742 [Mycena capillaripes]|nr:hypothetical protein B0H19DRAFT_1261742 [Mycena capillaripes]